MERAALRDGAESLMSWRKIDDDMPDHEKWLLLQDRWPERWANCMALWLVANCYAGKRLTDGRVPMAMLRQRTPIGDADLKDAIAALVELDLWELRDGEYWIHDYLDHNDSREAVEAKRAADAERKRHNGKKGGKTSGSTRGSKASASTANVRQQDSARIPAGGQSESERHPKPPPRPAPPYTSPIGGEARAPEADHPSILADDELLALTEPLSSGPDRERAARALWLRQEQIRQRVVPGAPSLAGSATPGGPLDAVRLALGVHSPADLCRVLAVREAEAECLRDSEDDPLRYLNGRTNWTAANLGHALATTPEAMRQRFAAERKRSGRMRPEEPVRKIRLLADLLPDEGAA